MYTKNFNKRPYRYHKLIEAISVILIIIFCIWLLTACKKKNNNVTPQTNNTWYNTQILEGYNTLKYKTFIAKPKYDNKGVIWGYCQLHYSETSNFKPEEKIDTSSITISLRDSSFVDQFGRTQKLALGNITTRFLPGPCKANCLETTYLDIKSITKEGVITLTASIYGNGYMITIDDTNISCTMISAGIISNNFDYKIINKY